MSPTDPPGTNPATGPRPATPAEPTSPAPEGAQPPVDDPWSESYWDTPAARENRGVSRGFNPGSNWAGTSRSPQSPATMPNQGVTAMSVSKTSGASSPVRGSGFAFIMILCVPAIIFGSLNVWVSTKFLTLHAQNVSGTAHGGFGEISLAGGIVLGVAALGILASTGALRRVLALVAAGGAGAALGITIYGLVHLQGGRGVSVDAGWGLIMTVAAASISVLAAVALAAIAGD